MFATEPRVSLERWANSLWLQAFRRRAVAILSPTRTYRTSREPSLTNGEDTVKHIHVQHYKALCNTVQSNAQLGLTIAGWVVYGLPQSRSFDWVNTSRMRRIALMQLNSPFPMESSPDAAGRAERWPAQATIR